MVSLMERLNREGESVARHFLIAREAGEDIGYLRGTLAGLSTAAWHVSGEDFAKIEQRWLEAARAHFTVPDSARETTPHHLSSETRPPTADEAWQAVSEAVKTLAVAEGTVEKAIALRGRILYDNAGDEELILSASLSALLVRELDRLSEAVDGKPAGTRIQLVLPRGWNDLDRLDEFEAWLDHEDRV